ncbi:MAG: BamA/TamA family outer membrane protein [Ignavibacteriaceae bacterium]
MQTITKILIATLLILLSNPLKSQCVSDSIKVIPQINYKAGSIHTFIFGDHWRDLWTTEVNVECLDLEKFAGGLTPIKTGGGMQTKSLQLVGKNGKIYKFRSIDKFPGRSLPDDFRSSIVESFMQDQITTINPYSSVIVSSLIEPTGILNSPAELYKMPESYLLDEFEGEYSKMFGTIEEKADEYDNENLNFAGAVKIRDTYKMFDELQEDNDNIVVATDYLKARLFDILIGDRDRHAGQWDWAEYRIDKKRIYKPIPKDRDYAFPLYDGLIPRLLTVAITSYVHFDYEMPSMLDMTWEGRHLDRRILGSIDKPVWDSVAIHLQSILTDEVIKNSIESVPDEIKKITYDQLVNKLINRRDKLKSASDEYYRIVSQYVDIHLSDKNEFVEIDRSENNFTTVYAYKRDKRNGNKNTELIYERKFDHNYTEEIRLHLKNGNDKAVLRGFSENPILVVIDGGNGDDELIDSSVVSSLKNYTKFFDSGNNTLFVKSNSTYINTQKYLEPVDESEKYEPKIEDRYYDFGVLVPFGISSDYGLIMGLGGGFNFYDYRIKPYSYRFEAEGSYAYLTRSLKFETNAYFNQLLENWQIKFTGKISQIEITKFSGLGNETVRDPELNEQDYYQVEQNRYSLSTTLLYNFDKNINLNIGSAFESSHTEKEEDDLTFLNDYDYYGTGKLSYLSLSTGITFNFLDYKDFPQKGYFANLGISYLPKVFNLQSSFVKSKIDLRMYFENELVTNNTLSFRAAGEYLNGRYPFFFGASLGGSKGLKGFPTNRFVGDASLLFQSEWRIYIGKPRIIIPGKFGIKLFAETGRVFLEDEKSDRWHNSFGGGLYFDILERFLTTNVDIAASKEWTRFYFYFTKTF